MAHPAKVKTLTILNIILILLLVAVSLHEQYPKRMYQRFSGNRFVWEYQFNPFYGQLTGIYPLYKHPKTIVMLGDSYVANAQWSEILDRCDVAARGIGNDMTSGYLQRLDGVFSVRPSICFIEGGINDITFGISPDTITQHLGQLIDALSMRQITPVLHTINSIQSHVPGADTLRPNITATNQKIRSLARSKNISIIDLESLLSPEGFLKPEFSSADGQHLNAAGYIVWRQQIEAVLKENGI